MPRIETNWPGKHCLANSVVTPFTVAPVTVDTTTQKPYVPQTKVKRPPNPSVIELQTNLNTKFFSFLNQSISYRYVERTKGVSYNLVDAKVSAEISKLTLSLNANNIFNTNYIEVGLIPMPKGNLMLGLAYKVY